MVGGRLDNVAAKNWEDEDLKGAEEDLEGAKGGNSEDSGERD